MTLNKFIEVAVGLFSVFLLIGLIVLIGHSMNVKATKDRRCDSSCGIRKSIVMFDNCFCKTEDGWQQQPPGGPNGNP
jgi:hypothetical protein